MSSEGPPPPPDGPPRPPGMPPPGFKAEESRISIIIPALSACLVVGFVSTIFRMWARRKRNLKLGLDDWLMIVATALSFPDHILPLVQTRYGYGTHIWNVPPMHIPIFLKIVYATSPFNAVSLTIIKLSILAFYHKVFAVAWFRKLVWAVAGLSVAWGLLTLIGFLNLCTPPHRLWDPMVDGTCIDIVKFSYGFTVIAMVVDFIIVVLPAPLVFKLKTSLGRRLALVAVFSLGLCAVLSCILRLPVTYLFAANDITYDVMPFQLLGAAENTIGILCGNFPIIYPAIAEGFDRMGTAIKRSVTGSGMHDTNNSSSNRRSSHYMGSGRAQSWKPLSDSASRSNSEAAFGKQRDAGEELSDLSGKHVQTSARAASEGELELLDSGAVQVRSEVSWKYETKGVP